MAETTEKSTHKTAKGRTINGKPDRRRTRRAGARAKRPLGPQKTAQAEAQKRKKTTVPRKRPRASATIQLPEPGAATQQLAVDGAPDTTQPAEPGKPGLDRLTEAVDAQLDAKKCEEIAKSLANQAAGGNASSAKVLIMLADQKKRKVEMEMNQLLAWEIVHGLDSEPEYQEPAKDNAEIEKPVPVVVETIHAVAVD